MTTQLALDLAPLVTPDYAPNATIQQRFEQWQDVFATRELRAAR